VAETVLGHHPEYLEEAERRNANCFNLHEDIWNSMSDMERWQANRQFLDDAISRGDGFILATPLHRLRRGSFFEKELEYLASCGYRLSDDGARYLNFVMARNFTQQVYETVGPLLAEHGFSVVESKEDPQHFGDATILFESRLLHIRVVKDRGDILVDVAENALPTEWHKLEDVLQICRPIMNRAGPPSMSFMKKAQAELLEEYDLVSRLQKDIKALKRILTKHLGTIEDRFGPNQIALTRQILGVIEQRESRAVAERIFGKSD
jgi:hypothetical protein